MATNREVERWGLDRLRPHPRQGRYCPDAPAHELEELAADMKANGQMAVRAAPRAARWRRPVPARMGSGFDVIPTLRRSR
jgi:hypothetical protein